MYRLSPVLCWFCKREFQKLFSQYRSLSNGLKPPDHKAASRLQQRFKMSEAINPHLHVPS